MATQLLYVLILNLFNMFWKYVVINELQNQVLHSQWIDEHSGLQLLQLKTIQGFNVIGQFQSFNSIAWHRQYAIPNTNRLYGYLEIYLSGSWNNDELQIFGNGVKLYDQKFTFDDRNRQSNENFIYSSQIYFLINQPISGFLLQIKVQKPNLGLYIQNIILIQQTQVGRDAFIPFSDYIPICANSWEQFNDYDCQCGTEGAQDPNCQGNCASFYQYLPQTDGCDQSQNCNACGQIAGALACAANQYLFTDPDTLLYSCQTICPEGYIGNDNTQECDKMEDYLSVNENNGFPVNHYFFFKKIDDFFHFYMYNDIKINIYSYPIRISEKPFSFVNQQFVAGSYERFQSQTIQLMLDATQPQYQILFRAKAHFIDFYPQGFAVIINNQYQQLNQIISDSITNEQQQGFYDYEIQLNLKWLRQDDTKILQNSIVIQVLQPQQNGDYIGYFYLDNIHLYQYECMTGCQDCFNTIACPPCTNPANKNPKDCTCNAGYLLSNDICIKCPSICSICTSPGVCDGCNIQTLRINPPNCDKCPQQYFVQSDVDNCQNCIDGCKVCTNNSSCTNCLPGYYRNSSNKCVQQCSDGQYQDNSDINDPKCSICNLNCLTCQNSPTYCLTCNLGSGLFGNNTCSNCKAEEYFDNSQQKCLNCNSNCYTCDQNKICSVCNDAHFYFINTNECLSICYDGYYGNTKTKQCEKCDISCQTCIDKTSKDCLSCFNGKYLNFITSFSGECQLNCAIGYYKDNDSCQKCWKGCATCVDSTSTCITCAPLYYKLISTGLCYDKCPDGYFKNSIGFVCSYCNLNCATCYASTDTNCLSCNYPLALLKNMCVKDCGIGYFNDHNVCVECTINCDQCYGIGADQCLQCSIGFYSLNSQCFSTCPKNFKNVRPQYICQCENLVDCVTCDSEHYYLNNDCVNPCPIGYVGFNKLCIQCDISCQTCSDVGEDKCLSCNSGLFLYHNRCLKQCEGNTYPDTTDYKCKDCSMFCYACKGPNDNNCTACNENLVLTQQNTCEQICPLGQYQVLSEKRCYYCDSTCLSCFGSSSKNCLTCTNYFYLHQCVDSCPDGFTKSINSMSCEPNFAIVIAQCQYQCATCILTARFCKSCAANRAPNPPNCDCELGYYDDGIHSACKPCDNKCLSCTGISSHCLKCKGDRILPFCDCPSLYYDDGSVYCVKCQDNCRTCDDKQCLTCLADRINVPDCICPDGYFEAYQYYCQECSQRCSTCYGTPNVCLSCSDIRIQLPICLCPNGYFENSNIECQKCDPSCHDCNKYGCISCAGNRVGPNQGDCPCDILGIDRIRIGSSYCTDCQLGVPTFTLNENFSGFSFSFGGQVLINTNVQTDYCQLFFDIDTLKKLGTNPQCDDSFNVIFGDNPTIQVDDNLQLNLEFILPGCINNFKSIFPMPLKISTSANLNTLKPIVQMKALVKPNICDSIKFEIDKLFYNGKQAVTIISWNSVYPQNVQEIDSVLQLYTQNQSQFVIFPPKTFQVGIIYKFSVTVVSFAKLQNTIGFQFDPVHYSIITFNPINLQSQFNRFQQITISNQIGYINCEEQNPPPQQLLYEIKVLNTNLKPASGVLTQNLIDGFTFDIGISFEPYTFDLGSYTLIYNTYLKRPDYNISYSNEYDIYIKPYDPILSILGGDRMTSYSKELYLNLSIQDYDLQTNTLNYYDCIWQCRDIVNGTACLDVNSQVLVFDKQQNQYLPAFTFKPYSVFIFEATIDKFYQNHSTKVTIQLMETDVEKLIVKGIDTNKTHNYYDEFVLQLTYPGINPDLLMYAGAVIYHNVVEATFEFFYLDFKFKLENYFIGLNETLNNTVKLRLSIYDPRFIMPSLNSQILTMNIPPTHCYLNVTITSNFVEFLDYITINVLGCYDTDYPLLYSLLLFANKTIYEQEQKTTLYYNYLTLVPSQQYSQFNLTLPYQGHLDALLLVNIVDSFDGISNITQTVQIKQYFNITEDTINNLQKSWKTFDDQLIGYRILSQRLSIYEGLQEYKVKLVQELLNLDQNQTLLSNQTETLYHSLSCIIGSNQTLLYINDTALLIQINYRVHIAYQKLVDYQTLQNLQKLSSKENIDKQNYIKQYFSYLDLMSSFIKYRLDQSQACVDIRNLHQMMIDQLQTVSVINEPLYQLLFYSVNLDFGMVTAKIANQITGSLGNVGTNISTEIYKYSLTRYYINPFYYEQGFPKNSSGYQAIDPKITQQFVKNQNANLQSPIKYKFPIPHEVPKNVTLKCISKVDQAKWKADICKTVQKGNEVVCECEQLSPTTLMEQLDYLIDKGEDVFSLNTLEGFASYSFYKTVVFYFYTLITGGYVVLVYWGMKVDHLMYAQIAVEKQFLDDRFHQKKIHTIQNIENVQNANAQRMDTIKLTEKELDKPIVYLDAFSGRTIFSKINIKKSLSRLITHYSELNSIKVDDQTNIHSDPKSSSKEIHIPDLHHKININSSLASQANLLQTRAYFPSPKDQSTLRSSNILKRKQNQQKQQSFIQNRYTLRGYLEYLKYFHQILSLIYKDDQEKPRGLRASIVYTSTIGSLAVLFVFSQPDNLNFTIILAAVTAPANKIYQTLLEKFLASNKRFVRIIGAFVMIIVGGLMSYTMLAGLVLQGQISLANQWSYVFIGTFSSDNFVYSPLTLLVKYLIHMRDYRSKFLQKIVDKIFDVKAKQYLKKKIEEI